MPKRVLSLDLGTNSIGWALVDEEAKTIVGCGVRVFPEGVNRDTRGSELSKNEARRIARGVRRQIARRSRRKLKLRQALVIAGLLPTSADDQRALDQLNPYTLRARALREPLTLHEIGRVLVHLNQRRGFLSNKKADKARKTEESKTLAEISVLEDEIERAGHITLGQHLSALYDQDPSNRIRRRHTRRDMYVKEFNAIWDAQKQFHPELLTDALRYGARGLQTYPRKPSRLGKDIATSLREVGIYGLIFFQRPMYWPISAVGQCELNPKEKRCPRADRITQRFRIIQELNNLRIIKNDGEILELSPEQRKKAMQSLSENADITFERLRKKLGLLEGDGFNLEFGGRTKLLGMETDSLMARKSCYGKSWHDLSDESKNSIVRSLIHDDEAEFRRRAAEEWHINGEAIEAMISTNLPDGYASYGRVTIERLLPHLEQGLPLMSRDGMPCAVRLAGFLPPWERPIRGGQYLPPPPDVTNPIVKQGLYEVRKLINAIVREFGKPDSIHIELARDIKGTARMRAEASRRMREREAERNAASLRLSEHGEKPTHNKIDLYLLWKEQRETCIYSGRPISLSQLLGGEANVDHVLPYSRSLDDSLMNKVVCFRDENDAKGNKTVYEWLASTNPTKYEAVLQRAAQLPISVRNRKRPRFSQKTCEVDDFINRQLTDTAYITTAVQEYVRTLGVDVVASKGQLTAELRYQWGLNEILRSDALNLKSREDHRHHAVDALVIAVMNRSRLQQLAKRRPGTSISAPWETFRRDVEQAVNAIKVSHRVQRKVSGPLHEETLYGPTPQQGAFVYRKNLDALKPAMIEDIRDPTIKSIVLQRLRDCGVDIAVTSQIPSTVWEQPLLMPSGTEIKKVRLLRTDLTITRIGNRKAHVKSGSNHHVCVFEYTDPRGKQKREPIWVSMLEAARRVRNHLPIVHRNHPTRPDATFVMSIGRGESFLAQFGGTEKLVTFRTGASTQGQLYFVEHCDGRPDKSMKKFVATANSFKGKKVVVDMLGKIRWAND